MNLKKKTTVEKISESEKSALYSISFENDGTTEFEKFGLTCKVPCLSYPKIL